MNTTCIICGSPFSSIRRTANLCSKECRKENTRRYHRAYSQRRRAADPDFREKQNNNRREYYARNPNRGREASRKYRLNNLEKCREAWRAYDAKNRNERNRKNALRHREKKYWAMEKHRNYKKEYRAKLTNLLSVLRAEMPDLLKEFGL